MKKLLTLLCLNALIFACAAAGKQWSGQGKSISQAIPIIQEELQNRLQEFGLLKQVRPIAPIYAFTDPELKDNIFWKTPYQLKVFNTSAGAGYAIVFGPQSECPQSGAVDCNLGLMNARLAEQPLSRKVVSEIPLLDGVKGYVDGGGMWWRIGKTNYDLVLTRMTPVQQLVFVNAALMGDRINSAKLYKFTGKIGLSDVSTMDLRQVNNEFWGSYTYKKTSDSKSRLYVHGSLKNGIVTLQEFDLNLSKYKPITGTFTGRLASNGIFSGTWISTSGKRVIFRMIPSS